MGNRRGIALTLYNLGAICLRAGELSAARDHLLESLSILESIGDLAGAAFVMESVAALVNESGAPGVAARLYGAAAALREASRGARPPVDEPQYQEDVGRTRSTLGEARFSAAYASGWAFTLRDAVDLAHQELSS